jgi:tRNA A-37 threonylcarbamoyl transferase component Bud32
VARDLNDPTLDAVEVPTRAGGLPAGALVGGYELTGLLGAGGMGQVYAAVHPVIGKRVAIKVLLPAMSRDPEVVQRFVTEARAVNRIGHPNIVDIFAFGELEDGRHFMAMDLLVGESLRQRLARGPLPVGEVLAILDAVSSALIAAHAHGIVHRDLKPDNVFLAEVAGGGTQVKLLDFGIAKLLGGQGMTTQIGALLGTPAYMSPEQARAEPIDARSDIYALGIVAWELLVGDLPFDATSYVEVLEAHVEQMPPPPSSRAPGIPPEVDALIGAMLAKQADQRPALADVRATIAAVMRGMTPPPGVTAVAVTAPRAAVRRAPAIVLGAVLFAGAAVLAWWQLRRDPEPEAVAPAPVPVTVPTAAVDAAPAPVLVVDAAPVVDAEPAPRPAPLDAPPRKSRRDAGTRTGTGTSGKDTGTGTGSGSAHKPDCDPMRSLGGC